MIKINKSHHPRSRHSQGYDFDKLTVSNPALSDYTILTKNGRKSIDFHNPKAVKELNSALLKMHYQIEWWDIPEGYLIPPIPSRADYIHHMADRLSVMNNGKVPKGNKVTCLDIGTGSNLIYPIAATRMYGWTVTGTDIDKIGIANAKEIVSKNNVLQGKISLRMQKNKENILMGIVQEGDLFDLVVCNPPFYNSKEEAEEASTRKQKTLHKKNTNSQNFGGKPNELITKGGELGFITQYIKESKAYAHQILLFSSLVSSQSNLTKIIREFKNTKDLKFDVINQVHGQKTSHIVSWTYLSDKKVAAWRNFRWA